MFLKVILLFLFCSSLTLVQAASAPLVWSTNPNFRSGRKEILSMSQSTISIHVSYSRALTSSNLIPVALGVMDINIQVDLNNVLYFDLQLASYVQAGFDVQLKTKDKSLFHYFQFKYFSVDKAYSGKLGIYHFIDDSTHSCPMNNQNTRVNLNDQGNDIMSAPSNIHIFGTLIGLETLNNFLNFGIQVTYSITTNNDKVKMNYDSTSQQCSFYFIRGSAMVINLQDAIDSIDPTVIIFAQIRRTENRNVNDLKISHNDSSTDSFMVGLNSFKLNPANSLTFATTITNNQTLFTLSTKIQMIEFPIFQLTSYNCPLSHPYFNVNTTLCYDDCGIGLGQNTTSIKCFVCQSFCKKCSDLTTCTDCYSQNFRRLQNGQCIPMDGYYQNYNQVAGKCLEPCLLCSNNQNSCDSCIGANHYSLISLSNQCIKCFQIDPRCVLCQNQQICIKCQQGYQVDSGGSGSGSGVPSGPVGCVQSSCNLKQDGCLLCYTVNSNACYKCDSNGYQLNQLTSLCDAVCGDGIFIQRLQQCQDGNRLDLDGCSPQCKIQNNFECPISPTTFISNCTYTSFIDFSLNNLIKIDNSNKVSLELKLSPILRAFQSYNFSRLIQTDLSISQYLFQYDNNTGTVKMTMTYSQTIESIDALFTISKPQNQTGVFRSLQPSTQKLMMQVANEPLIYYDPILYDMSTVIFILSVLLSGIAWIMLFIGLYSGKIIGLETINSLQLVYISLLTIENEINPCIKGLKGLSFSNGLNIVSFIPEYSPYDYQMLPYTYKKIGFFTPFILNFNFNIFIMVTPWIIFLVLLIMSKTCFQKQKKKINNIQFSFLYEIALSFLIVFQYIYFSSLGIQIRFGFISLTNGIDYLSLIIGLILLIPYIAYFILLLLNPKKFGQFRSFFQVFIPHAQKYYLFVILKIMVSSFIISVSNIPYSIIIPVLFCIIEGVILIAKKPHKNIRNTYRCLANQIISLVCLLCISFYAFAQSQVVYSSIGFYLPLIVIVLLLILVSYNIIFFIMHLRQAASQSEIKDQMDKQIQKINELRLQAYQKQGSVLPNIFFMLNQEFKKKKQQQDEQGDQNQTSIQKSELNTGRTLKVENLQQECEFQKNSKSLSKKVPQINNLVQKYKKIQIDSKQIDFEWQNYQFQDNQIVFKNKKNENKQENKQKIDDIEEKNAKNNIKKQLSELKNQNQKQNKQQNKNQLISNHYQNLKIEQKEQNKNELKNKYTYQKIDFQKKLEIKKLSALCEQNSKINLLDYYNF